MYIFDSIIQELFRIYNLYWLSLNIFMEMENATLDRE